MKFNPNYFSNLSLKSFLLEVAIDLEIPDEERNDFVALWQEKLGLCKTMKILRTLLSQPTNWANIDIDESAKAIIAQKLESDFEQGTSIPS
jgi:hypothetical protein